MANPSKEAPSSALPPLSAVSPGGVLQVRPGQQQLNQLSAPTEHSLAAAVAQSLSLACICMAFSLTKWILLLPSQSSQQEEEIAMSMSYTFGIPNRVEMHNQEEVTTGVWEIEHFGMTGSSVIQIMVGACFVSILFGFVAFLLDFMDMHEQNSCRITVATALHILSGLFLVSVLVTCVWWFLAIEKMLKKPEMRKFRLTAALGESFFVALLSFLCVIPAAVLSFWSMKLSEQEGPHRHRIVCFQRQPVTS